MNKLIELGLNHLVKSDTYLLMNKVSERSITHRLGMYYQVLFPEWDVDCEFNRNLGAPKTIDIYASRFLNQMADILELDTSVLNREVVNMLRGEHVSREDILSLRTQLRDETRIKYSKELDILYFVLSLPNGEEINKLIVPDIIIHKRGTSKNYIVIEAKKSDKTNGIARAFDLVKLFTLVRRKEYKYSRGYFIDLPVGSKLVSHKKFKFTQEIFESKVYSVEST